MKSRRFFSILAILIISICLAAGNTVFASTEETEGDPYSIVFFADADHESWNVLVGDSYELRTPEVGGYTEDGLTYSWDLFFDDGSIHLADEPVCETGVLSEDLAGCSIKFICTVSNGHEGKDIQYTIYCDVLEIYTDPKNATYVKGSGKDVSFSVKSYFNETNYFEAYLIGRIFYYSEEDEEYVLIPKESITAKATDSSFEITISSDVFESIPAGEHEIITGFVLDVQTRAGTKAPDGDSPVSEDQGYDPMRKYPTAYIEHRTYITVTVEEEDVPDTGDVSGHAVYAALTVISLIGLAGVSFGRRKLG